MNKCYYASGWVIGRNVTELFFRCLPCHPISESSPFPRVSPLILCHLQFSPALSPAMRASLNLIPLARKRALQPRTRKKRTLPRTTPEQRASAAKKAAEKRKLIEDLCMSEWGRQDEAARTISLEANCSLKKVTDRLQRRSKFISRRAVSAHNAWIHVKSLVINDGIVFMYSICVKL